MSIQPNGNLIASAKRQVNPKEQGLDRLVRTECWRRKTMRSILACSEICWLPLQFRSLSNLDLLDPWETNDSSSPPCRNRSATSYPASLEPSIRRSSWTPTPLAHLFSGSMGAMSVVWMLVGDKWLFIFLCIEGRCAFSENVSCPLVALSRAGFKQATKPLRTGAAFRAPAEIAGTLRRVAPTSAPNPDLKSKLSMLYLNAVSSVSRAAARIKTQCCLSGC